jgi:hypothetical protein
MKSSLKSRNKAMLWVLIGLSLLLYGIAFVRMNHLGH